MNEDITDKKITDWMASLPCDPFEVAKHVLKTNSADLIEDVKKIIALLEDNDEIVWQTASLSLNGITLSCKTCLETINHIKQCHVTIKRQAELMKHQREVIKDLSGASHD